MKRRDFLAAGAGQLAPKLFAGNRAPNVLFILADDLGYADLSCYGRRDYRTPNIDRLASEGVRFTHAYANSPVCSATRTALMTGRYQYRLPVGLEEPIPLTPPNNPGLPPSHPTLPSLLRSAGYATHLVGKWHLGRLPDFGPLQSGYDHFWGFRSGAVDYFTHKYRSAATDTDDLWDDDRPIREQGYLTTLLGKRAVQVIQQAAASTKPFFLSLHFNAPHWPWEGPGDEAESRRIARLDQNDGGSQATYARMVRALDDEVGNVLATLKSSGAASNTIVVFTSDNGGERYSDTWPFTGKKSELLEGGLRIPAIVRWPGRIRANSTTEQTAVTMDWLPTLLAAAGTTPAASHVPDGANLLPVLTGGPTFSRKLFWRYRYRAQRAMLDGAHKWLEIDGNRFLFNVVNDPLERANLKNREPEIFERMAREWSEWNASMLPESTSTYTYGFEGDDLADHFGTGKKR